MKRNEIKANVPNKYIERNNQIDFRNQRRSQGFHLEIYIVDYGLYKMSNDFGFTAIFRSSYLDSFLFFL